MCNDESLAKRSLTINAAVLERSCPAPVWSASWTLEVWSKFYTVSQVDTRHLVRTVEFKLLQISTSSHRHNQRSNNLTSPVFPEHVKEAPW